MSHWYDGETGEARYEVPKKKGDGMRGTTIRDARENGYVPSVTTILKTIGSQALQGWIVDQHLKAAYEICSRGAFDSDYKEWKKGVKILADEERSKAASFGTAFHDGVEAYFNDQPIHPDVMPWVRKIDEWTVKNLTGDHEYLKSEFHIDPRGGYGGRCDLRDIDKNRMLCIVDFKSQKRKEKRDGTKLPFNFYPSWGAQGGAYLSANRLMLPGVPNDYDGFRIISVVVDSEDPDFIDEKDWDYEESMELFNAAFRWFKVEHNWS